MKLIERNLLLAYDLVMCKDDWSTPKSLWP
jgi:hypothetical protein